MNILTPQMSTKMICTLFEEPPELYDLEDFVFNSEITEDEILRVVRALKPDKSAGPDNIVAG